MAWASRTPPTTSPPAHGRRESVWLRGARIANDNTHGTGCSLSSAIACGLAGAFAVDVAVRDAKAYVAGALAAGLNLGRGSGPPRPYVAVRRPHALLRISSRY